MSRVLALSRLARGRPCSLLPFVGPSGFSQALLRRCQDSPHLPDCRLLSHRALGGSCLFILIPGYLLQVDKCFGVGWGLGR